MWPLSPPCFGYRLPFPGDDVAVEWVGMLYIGVTLPDNAAFCARVSVSVSVCVCALRAFA